MRAVKAEEAVEGLKIALESIATTPDRLRKEDVGGMYVDFLVSGAEYCAAQARVALEAFHEEP